MRKLLNLLPWRRRRLDRELDRELRDHMERRIDDLQRSGAGVADARRQAALEFGGLSQVREDVRETWVWAWLDNLGRDVQYGFRTLRRSPAFAITALQLSQSSRRRKRRRCTSISGIGAPATARSM